MSEQDLVRATLAALNFAGFTALRLNAGLTVLGKGAGRRVIRGVEAGTPDILVLLPGGRVVWLEMKTAAGKLSESQKAWHARALRLIHPVWVCRTVGQAVNVAMGERDGWKREGFVK